MPELTFKGKVHVTNHHLVVPFHELVPVNSKGIAKTPSLHDNLLIHGDNLLALKALLPTHSGKIKCIYIDPPYNTGNEGWAYNDKVNSPLMRDWLGKTIDREDLTRHDKWCSMMLPRLKLLRELLTEDGAIFVSIDDNEVHHLRCLMDEVFGEENFVANIIWEKKYTRSNDAKFFSANHDHVVCYSKVQEQFTLKGVARTSEQDDAYKNIGKHPRGLWKATPLHAKSGVSTGRYKFKNGVIWSPPPGTFRRFNDKRMAELDANDAIWFGKNGDASPSRKTFLSEVSSTLTPTTIWKHEEVGSTHEANSTLKDIFGDPAFQNSKPPRLIQRILQIARDKDSLILDSFAGSGTTGHAVMKQNAEDGGTRRFVLIETEDYADTTTAERLRRCIKGVPTAKDAALKKGYGGSFSYFKLGSAVALQTILEAKDLPTYGSLASYVFFTATGEEFDPAAMNPKTNFIGKSKAYDVYLLYTPDIEALKDLALDLPTVRALPEVKGSSERKRLVFAPTRFMDDSLLHQHGIVFSQLPYEIYERVEKTSK